MRFSRGVPSRPFLNRKGQMGPGYSRRRGGSSARIACARYHFQPCPGFPALALPTAKGSSALSELSVLPCDKSRCAARAFPGSSATRSASVPALPSVYMMSPAGRLAALWQQVIGAVCAAFDPPNPAMSAVRCAVWRDCDRRRDPGPAGGKRRGRGTAKKCLAGAEWLLLSWWRRSLSAERAAAAAGRICDDVVKRRTWAACCLEMTQGTIYVSSSFDILHLAQAQPIAPIHSVSTPAFHLRPQSHL